MSAVDDPLVPPSSITVRKGLFGVISLREHLDAKLDRKTELLAELASIDNELAEAYKVLGDLSSPADAPKAARRLVEKPCLRCHGTFMLGLTQKYCTTCFKDQARERMAKIHERKRAFARVPAGARVPA